MTTSSAKPTPMDETDAAAQAVTTLSAEAKETFRQAHGDAFLLNDWDQSVFLHYEVAPGILQPFVPFELNQYDGRAFVSLVAFSMRHCRLRSGGRLINWLTAPFSSHGFLNVRTYVRHRGETGIFFLAEWLPSRLSVLMGPRTYGLPFRLGTLDYHHDHDRGSLFGSVHSANPSQFLKYEIEVSPEAHYEPCRRGTLDEFLLERYTAFTKRGRTVRQFRVWHEPWPQGRVQPTFLNASMLQATGTWANDAQFCGAHYSPGAKDVWMSRPRCLPGPGCAGTWPIDPESPTTAKHETSERGETC